MPEMKNVYLLAWLGERDEKPNVFFEFSSSYRYRNQHSHSIIMIKDNVRVTAYCDHIHGVDILTKAELREVAQCYLDDNMRVTTIDFTK